MGWEIVGRNRPGDKVSVKFVREGKIKDVEAVLKNKSGNTDIVKKDESSVKDVLGVELTDPDKKDLDKLKLKGGAKVGVLAPGKFRDSGIREGFIITRIDKTDITNFKDAQKMLQESDGEGHLIEGYYPNGEKRFYGLGW